MVRIQCTSVHLCILILDEAKASVLSGGVVHGYVYILDVAKRDEGRVQDGFIDVFLQTTHIECCFLVRPLASNDDCNTA